MTKQLSSFDKHWFIVAIAIVVYIIPWVINPGSGLSLGAYDFAEFLTKRPFTEVTYNTVFTLRAQLLLIAWYLAFGTQGPLLTLSWWVRTIFCLLLVISQLPPLTFIDNLSDANQQQQAMLAWQSLIGIGFGLSGVLWHVRHYLWLIISIVGFVTSLYGLINAIMIMRAYNVPAMAGLGGIVLIALYIGLAIWNFVQLRRRQT